MAGDNLSSSGKAQQSEVDVGSSLLSNSLNRSGSSHNSVDVLSLSLSIEVVLRKVLLSSGKISLLITAAAVTDVGSGATVDATAVRATERNR